MGEFSSKSPVKLGNSFFSSRCIAFVMRRRNLLVFALAFLLNFFLGHIVSEVQRHVGNEESHECERVSKCYGGRSRRTRLFRDQLDRAGAGSWQIADGGDMRTARAHVTSVGDLRVHFVVEP